MSEIGILLTDVGQDWEVRVFSTIGTRTMDRAIYTLSHQFEPKLVVRQDSIVTDLLPGMSVHSNAGESQSSMANRFTLVAQVDTGNQAVPGVTQIIQHGAVMELVGSTEPGSTVIINHEQVFSLDPDGTFRHFTTPPSESGLNQLTI